LCYSSDPMVISQRSHEFKTTNGNILKTILTEVSTAERLVMVVPGAQASVSGENANDRRYNMLARKVSKEVGCSVIRFSNTFRPEYGYFDEEVNIQAMLAKTAEVVGGKAVTGFGFSAGARMLAEHAHELESIDKLVLVNPDPGFEPEKVLQGLKKFEHPIRLISGGEDEMERREFTDRLFQSSSKGVAQLYLPAVDHMFTDSIEVFAALGKYTA